MMGTKNSSIRKIAAICAVGVAFFLLKKPASSDSPIPPELPSPPSPEPPAPPVTQPFTYQPVEVGVTSVPVAPVWKQPVFKCRIANPSGSRVTNTVTFHTQKVTSVAQTFSQSFPVTLEAGASFLYEFNNVRPGPGGYVYVCMGDGTWDTWLEDSAGGKSPVFRQPHQTFP